MTKRNLLKPRRKYATPKPGSTVVIEQWSLRCLRCIVNADDHSFVVCPKGAGSSHWNGLATIYPTKGGCYIVSSNRAKLDAFASWDMAVDEALRRAARGHRYGEG